MNSLLDYHQRHYYHGQFALLTSTWSFKLHATKYKTSELITEQGEFKHNL